MRHVRRSATCGEAARYLRLSPATLRSWFVGRPYPTGRGVSHFRPLLAPARREPTTLSFSNLIEAHVLRALRTEHGVPLAAVRPFADSDGIFFLARSPAMRPLSYPGCR